ncbi:hypothetical protein DVH05_002852 [Phytophthora capsici]|nr:hypothetical protein DVH05_002852 [Phytophthora capsici]
MLTHSYSLPHDASILLSTSDDSDVISRSPSLPPVVSSRLHLPPIRSGRGAPQHPAQHRYLAFQTAQPFLRVPPTPNGVSGFSVTLVA